MTEDEAKTKWCPMVRLTLRGDDLVDNRLGTTQSLNECCIASDCMMWVIDKPVQRLNGEKVVKEDGMFKATPNFEQVSCGHCGLIK